MNTYTTTYDTATIDIDQPETPAAAAEQPLDFVVLRKDAETAVASCQGIERGWKRLEAQDRIVKAAPRLIDMAERCEKAERERDQLKEQLAEACEATNENAIRCQAAEVERNRLRGERDTLKEVLRQSDDNHLTKVNFLVAERDRLKEQIAQAVAAREYTEQKLEEIQSQPSGLSEEDRRYMESFLGWEDSAPASAEGINHLLAIIDRLKRQKAVPWKKTAHIEKSGYYFWGNARGHNWGYLNAKDKCDEAIYHVSFDEILATLPKGDATP